MRSLSNLSSRLPLPLLLGGAGAFLALVSVIFWQVDARGYDRGYADGQVQVQTLKADLSAAAAAQALADSALDDALQALADRQRAERLAATQTLSDATNQERLHVSIPSPARCPEPPSLSRCGLRDTAAAVGATYGADTLSGAASGLDGPDAAATAACDAEPVEFAELTTLLLETWRQAGRVRAQCADLIEWVEHADEEGGK